MAECIARFALERKDGVPSPAASDTVRGVPHQSYAVVRALLLVSLALLACKRPGSKRGADSHATKLAKSSTTAAQTRPDGSVVLAKPGKDAHHIATNGSHVFFAVGHRDETVVLRVPVGGGTTEAVGRPGANVIGLAADSATLWVASWDGIHAYPVAGGNASEIAKERVHAFAEHGGEIAYSSKTTVYHVPKGGKPVGVATAQQNYVSNVGLDDSHVYWMNNRTKTLYRVPKAGGTPAPVVTGVFPAESHRIFVSGDELFYYQSVPRSFRKVKKTGGEASSLDAGSFHFRGMAVDDSYVY